ncbi:sugar (and other) transporter family protein [Acinetobacter baumannii 972082]|nr:sugar (and other) transporter family protein [Acinetobacter baumannii 972082]
MDNLQTNIAVVTQQRAKHTKTRYYILAMIFLVTAFNYGDRATLSMAATPMSHELGIDSVTMGYIFSAFAWAYVIGQIPGGWLLDKFGARRVYFWSLFLWSLFTVLIGFTDILGDTATIITSLFILIFLVGLSESPAFPVTVKLLLHGFQPKNVELPLPFLTHPLISRPYFSLPSWAGLLQPSTGSLFSGSWVV